VDTGPSTLSSLLDFTVKEQNGRPEAAAGNGSLKTR